MLQFFNLVTTENIRPYINAYFLQHAGKLQLKSFKYILSWCIFPSKKKQVASMNPMILYILKHHILSMFISKNPNNHVTMY